MICAQCGQQNEPDVKFCSRCGAQMPQNQQPVAPVNQVNYDSTANYGNQANQGAQGYADGAGYAVPQQQAGYTAPQAGYGDDAGYTAPPQQAGYAAPQAGYGDGTGYAVPQQGGYAAPQAGYGDQTGFGTPQQANYANQQGYGAPQGQEYMGAAPAGGKEKTKKGLPFKIDKKIIMIAIPAIVVIVAAIIIIPMLFGSGGNVRKDHIAIFTDRGEVVISGNNNAKFTIDGDIESYQLNLDGSKAAILVDYDYRNGGDLYFVTPSGAVMIADAVNAYRLSDTGDGIVFFTDYDYEDDSATLYLYDTSGRKLTLITDDGYYPGDAAMTGVAISPNGKSVGFIKNFDIRNYEFEGYIKIDGKNEEKLGDETFALAISNGGKHIYYYKVDVRTEEASLHVRSGRNEFRLVPDMNSITSIMFNKDYSQILFSTMIDGERRTFISSNGSERERISGAGIRSLVLPRGFQTRSYSTDFSNVTVYAFSSFSNFVARTDDGLAYYNKALEANKISSSDENMSSAEISSDGKTLYYINNSERLSSINPTVIGAERREIDRNVAYFVASTDGKTVYYVNDDEELYYASSGSSPKRIADDVLYNSLAMSYSGNKVFFLVDYRSGRGGELCFSNNGGVRTRVARAEDVMTVWATPTNIFYRTRDDEIFRSGGNETFAMFHDEIDSVRKY